MNNSHYMLLFFTFLLVITLSGHQSKETSLIKDETKLDLQLYDIPALFGNHSQNIKQYNSNFPFLTEDDTIKNLQKRQAEKKRSKIDKNEEITRKQLAKTTTKKPVVTPEQYIRNVINDINKKRKLHNSPPLVEDVKMSKYAQEYVELSIATKYNPKPREDPYSMLIFYTDVKNKINPVEEWYKYSKEYNYDNTMPDYPDSNFLLLIWKSISHIGCGAGEDNKYHIVFCFLSPRCLGDNINLNVQKPKTN